MGKLFNDIWESLLDNYNELVIFLPKLVIGVLIIISLWFIGNRSKRLIKNRLTNRIDDPLLASFLAQISKVFFVVLGLLLFLKTIGLGGAATSILATAGVSAFIIGFAFRDIGENFLAGIVLAFNRPFKVGDVIETVGIVGKVQGLSLREIHVKTFDGKDVYIPNGQILKNPLFNYTIDGFRRFDFNIGVDYFTDLPKACEIILQQMHQIDGILKETKAPDVTVSNFGEHKLYITVYFWINTFDPEVSVFLIQREAMNKCILALTKAGIKIPRNMFEIVNS